MSFTVVDGGVDSSHLNFSAKDQETVTVQDNQREKDLAMMFDLIRSKSRIGVDAYDQNGNPFELKTTSKGGVPTARDVGPHTLLEWTSKYWIIARGKNLSTGFRIDRVFFMAPSHLEGWVNTLREKFARDIAINEKTCAAVQGLLSDDEMARLRYILKRGILLNDPNIPWGYIEKNGVEITSDHAKRLAELVAAHPLDQTSKAA